MRDTDNFASLKDQHYFKSGELLETGFGFSRYGVNQTTPGVLPYVITPETAEGNYYLSAQTTAQRYQGVANLYLSPKQWHGRHEIKTGVDVDRIDYIPTFDRTPISYLSEGATLPTGQTCQDFEPFIPVTPTPCSRYSTFNGLSQTETYNLELSGYAQDTWSPADRVLIEPGVRFDWDEIVRAPLVSPRLAGTFVLDNEGNTKLSAGIGLFYDATNLVLISRPYAGERTDYFFGTDAAGNQTVTGPNFDNLHRESQYAASAAFRELERGDREKATWGDLCESRVYPEAGNSWIRLQPSGRRASAKRELPADEHARRSLLRIPGQRAAYVPQELYVDGFVYSVANRRRTRCWISTSIIRCSARNYRGRIRGMRRTDFCPGAFCR